VRLHPVFLVAVGAFVALAAAAALLGVWFAAHGHDGQSFGELCVAAVATIASVIAINRARHWGR
jgi:hypothetical protein